MATLCSACEEMASSKLELLALPKRPDPGLRGPHAVQVADTDFNRYRTNLQHLNSSSNTGCRLFAVILQAWWKQQVPKTRPGWMMKVLLISLLYDRESGSKWYGVKSIFVSYYPRTYLHKVACLDVCAFPCKDLNSLLQISVQVTVLRLYLTVLC
jgi:hypothetical protein